MAKLLTKAARAIIPPGKREILVFDDACPGFGIRKFSSGKSSFFVKYTMPNGQQRKFTLGPAVPGVADAMQQEAQRILAKAKLGQDTSAEKQAAAKKGATVGSLVPKYLAAQRSEVGKRYFVELVRYLESYWQPLHGIVIDEIKRKDIVTRLDEIAEERGKVTADRARAALSGLFAWAVDRSYLDANPAREIKRRANNGSRNRVLSEVELVEVWQACNGLDDYSRIVRLLILTGQRKSEISELSWPEIDREKALIDLPAERTKNRLVHLVPLSAEALAVLDAVPPRLGRDLVFGEGAGGFSGWTRAKEALDKRINAARAAAGKSPIPAWTVHDLRRSFITCVNDLGIAPPHVTESLVNHVSGHRAGVAGVYNKALYLPERRKALEDWGRHVAALVSEA